MDVVDREKAYKISANIDKLLDEIDKLEEYKRKSIDSVSGKCNSDSGMLGIKLTEDDIDMLISLRRNKIAQLHTLFNSLGCGV